VDAKTLLKIIKLAVNEEVTKIIRKELTLFKAQLIKEVASVPVSTKLATSKSSLANIVEEFTPRATQPQVKKKVFSNNPVINDILNETEPLREGYIPESDYPTMNGGVFTSNKAQGGLSAFRSAMEKEMGHLSAGPQKVTVDEMIPKVAENGAPMRVNPEALPDALKKALTRDYSALVKVMNKKK